MSKAEVVEVALALIFLVPCSILLGKFWRNGGGMVASAASTLLFLATLLIQVKTGHSMTNITLNYVTPIIWIGGALELFAGWALAVGDAIERRRRWWSVSLNLGLYVAAALCIYTVIGPENGCFMSERLCTPAMPAVVDGMALLAIALGPGLTLAYALSPQQNT